MWRYWKAAFWARPRIPGLGAVPLNLVGLGCFAILGLGHPGFWLLGLAGEVAYLYGMGVNTAWQRTVDTQALNTVLPLRDDQAEATRRELLERLSDADQARLAQIEASCETVLHKLQRRGAPDYTIDNSREALQKLAWSFLKLLLARREFEDLSHTTDEGDLRRQAAELEQELGCSDLPDSLRRSKADTLAILQKRLHNLDRREDELATIESDLARIEAQVNLAVEEAAMERGDTSIATDIEVARFFLDDGLYGTHTDAVAALDREYGLSLQPPAPPDTSADRL